MAEIRVTQAGALAEVGATAAAYVTQVGALAELGTETIRVTQAGALVEFQAGSPHAPVMGMGGAIIRYNHIDITAHLDGASLQLAHTVKDVQGLAAASELAKDATIGVRSAPLVGLWTAALDAIFGADAAQPPVTLRQFECILGRWNWQAAYVWAASFPARYEVTTNVQEAIVFAADIALSGACVRGESD